MASEEPPSESFLAADDLVRAGRLEEAVAAYEHSAGETPDPTLCLKLARCYESFGGRRLALRWALTVTDTADDFTSWQAAAALARRNEGAGEEPRRSARLHCSGATPPSQFATMLWLAALTVGVSLELYESPYGQYRQEILDPASSMYGFSPDLVVLAVHAGELALPTYSTSPEDDIYTEVERWHSLWRALGSRSQATVVQHLFALSKQQRDWKEIHQHDVRNRKRDHCPGVGVTSKSSRTAT